MGLFPSQMQILLAVTKALIDPLEFAKVWVSFQGSSIVNDKEEPTKRVQLPSDLAPALRCSEFMLSPGLVTH